MKFLVDESVSPSVSDALRDAGHDSIHVRDSLGTGSDDVDILREAGKDGRVIITQDRDFGALLHATDAVRTSVVLLRLRDGRPGTHIAAVLRVAELTADELTAGAVVAVDDSSIRIRLLPPAQT